MTDRPTDQPNLDWARFHEDVVFGRSGGRIIWQPRVLCWRADKIFAGDIERIRLVGELVDDYNASVASA
jgi:hypothetical protein